jgi:hypothetical protein
VTQAGYLASKGSKETGIQPRTPSRLRPLHITWGQRGRGMQAGQLASKVLAQPQAMAEVLRLHLLATIHPGALG